MKTLVATSMVAAASLAAAQQQPVFRTAADLVTVPVSVRANGTPVGGLRPEDFLVLDNGVPQKVQSLEGEAVPADITIVVETSRAMKDYIGTVNEQVAKISAMVRSTDRLEVIGVDTYVTQLLPLKAAEQQPKLDALKAGGFASINDAIIAALLRETDRERPHLVIVISDTIDTMSTSDMNAVRDVARESGATLEIAGVTLELEPGGSWSTSAERLGKFVRVPIAAGAGPTIGNARSVERAQYWLPHYFPPVGRHTEAFAPLREAAELTGGEFHFRGLFLDRTASGIFNRIYADYRHSYILRYAAEGVARAGWHEISVTAPKYPSYELHARKGYLVETPKPPLDTAKLPPGGLLALLSAENADDEVKVNRTIHENNTNADFLKLLTDFRNGGDAFPSAPRKEFVLAMDLAETALPSPYPPIRTAAYDLLSKYARFLPQVAGDDGFEKDWLRAELALAEAPVRPADAQKLVDAALKRFPAEPRFLLARAILSDQGATPKTAAGVIANFDAAAMDPSTRDEALVRKAFFLSKLGRQADGLAALDQTGEIRDDVTLRFWRELIRARTLDTMGRAAEAIGAFRAALAVLPEAQSARVGLMNALARSGQTADARVIAEAIQTARTDADDPWWRYLQADYRFFPELMKRLKGSSK